MHVCIYDPYMLPHVRIYLYMVECHTVSADAHMFMCTSPVLGSNAMLYNRTHFLRRIAACSMNLPLSGAVVITDHACQPLFVVHIRQQSINQSIVCVRAYIRFNTIQNQYHINQIRGYM